MTLLIALPVTCLSSSLMREWHGDWAVVRKKSVRETQNMLTADATVEDAARNLRRLVEYEKGRCAGDTDVALFRVTELWGIEPGAVNSLWKRPKTLTYVKAHVWWGLKQIDAYLEELAKRQERAIEETARILEERQSPAAGIARMAAEAAREEVETE
jgi:hypothetical protein